MPMTAKLFFSLQSGQILGILSKQSIVLMIAITNVLLPVCSVNRINLCDYNALIRGSHLQSLPEE